MPAPLRMRRGACRSAIPSLSTIAEEEEGQRSRKRRGKGGGSDYLLRADEKSSWSRPDSSASGQYTYTIPSPTEIHIVTRPEPLTLKIDERQRLVRERREELEKQNAARGSKWMEREERSRQFHERQLEERRKRLDEQRDKEDRRRAAVEEKRRQKLEEEKARYEAVIRRTMERSQRVRPKSNRWSWGGTLSASTSHNSGFDDSALFPLDLAGLEHYHGVFSVARQQQFCSKYTDRRSVSTMNLSKPTDPVISKRLSSSSATLLNSPDRALQKQTSLSSSCLIKKTQSKSQISKEKIPQDKPAGMRRMPLTPWENTMISRLQTPTHSYLARSRSAMSLSGEAASCHPMSSMSFKSIQSRGAERPVKAGLNLERPVRAGYIPPDSSTRRKTTQNLPIDRKDKDNVRKSWSNLSYPTTSLSLFTPKRSPSPVGYRSRVTNPSLNRGSTKPHQKTPNPKKSRSPPPPTSIPLSPSNPSLSPGNLRPNRVTSESPRVTPEGEGAKKEDVEPPKIEPEAPTTKSEPSPESSGSSPTTRPSAGTTDPEEASRLLAEKRRQAREQREREEEEKRRQEEAERRSREEMARRKAEERAKREEEAQRQAEEKKRREEEAKRLEEEKAQREREEAERLQRQKEEEEARQREKGERLRLEREKHFQKEEAERMERKKRLEEIMKRTRRSDQKTTSQRNGDVSQQSGQNSASSLSSSPSVSVSAPQAPETSETVRSDSNGHTGPSFITPILPTSDHSVTAQLRENGAVTEAFEEVIEVPMGTKLSRQDGDGEEVENEEEEKRKVPLLAFRENGSMHNVSGLDENPAQ
ncbi:ensconsin isoform X2 [Sinocyclocheilus anshuiensis]|uniref:ensconsin isoform X2 n=1 Tax=Sinocyclocheilus anshuiensis TaxID=1608454 RepID=UPI0007BA57A2|nr:PREDICTED: ensconsin-like isoform X2 [Sinocyclocheilus anshuiensis]